MRPVCRDVILRRRGAARHGGIVVRLRDTNRRSRLFKSFLRGFQVLVGDINLRFQCIQLRVFVNFPPIALRDLIARLYGFPIPEFLVTHGTSAGGRT